MTGSLPWRTSGAPRPVPQSVPESPEARERRLWPRAIRVDPLRFRTAPLLAAALCFALGASASRLTPSYSRPTFLLLGAAAALLALTLLSLRHAQRLAAPAVCALWFAAGLWAIQIEPAPAPQTALLAYADGLSRIAEARVVRIRELPPRTPDHDTDPDQWEQPGAPAWSIDLDLTAIEYLTPDISRMEPIAGGVRATLFTTGGPAPALHCGDRISAPVRLRLPERYRDPGAWQYADYLLDQGIAATTSLPAARLRLLPGPRPGLHCRLFAAQSWASARLLGFVRSTPNRHLPALLRLSPEDAGMLNAMLFGDRTRLSHALRLGFERTGSFHLFVVSGMHVALLAGGVFWLARRLRLGELLATLLTLSLSFAYALLTGFGVPVERALLMISVVLLTRLLFREHSALNALGAAALAVLIGSPRALFEASFQMTFLAIVAIAGIALPLAERTFLPYAGAARGLHQRWRDTALPPRLAQFRVMLGLWSEAFAHTFGAPARGIPQVLTRIALYALELAVIGLIAEAVMVLPMALYFHRATVFALPANMLSIPLVAMLAPLALATFCAALVSPWLAAVPAAATALLLHAITGAIAFASRSQAADLRLPGPTLARALLAAGCFALSLWAVRRSRRLAWAALPALALAAWLILAGQPAQLHPGQLEVTAIDVGQGDSLLIVSPTGHAMLVDAGGPTGAAANAENAAGASAFDIGEEVVSPYLWSRQLRRLDVIALTHAHSDHMGGMAAALRNFRPRELWVSVDSSTPAFRALLDEAAALHIPVRWLHSGDRPTLDGVAVSVLAPDATYTNAGAPKNNDSLVLRLQFGQASVLLEGDAEAPSERAMLAVHGVAPVTLLKVGHHGSRTSTTADFLAAAAPVDAVISVGRQNTFGHPRPEILARLAAAHAHVFRTDEFGLTTFLLMRDGKISTLTAASAP